MERYLLGLAAEQSKVFSIYNFVDDLKDRFNATKEFIGQTKEFIDKSKEIKATLDEQVRQELTYNLSDKEENIDIDDIYEKIKDTDSKENEESNQDIENENKELNETEGKEIGSIEESELEDLQKEKEMIESWKEHPYYDRLMNSEKQANEDRLSEIGEKIDDTDSKENEESNQDIENENKELNETEGKEVGSIEESELEDLQKEKEMIESWKEHPGYDRLMNSEKQANEDRLSEIGEKIDDTDSKENEESNQDIENENKELNETEGKEVGSIEESELEDLQKVRKK